VDKYYAPPGGLKPIFDVFGEPLRVLFIFASIQCAVRISGCNGNAQFRLVVFIFQLEKELY
jgi:hypothetical protein